MLVWCAFYPAADITAGLGVEVIVLLCVRLLSGIGAANFLFVLLIVFDLACLRFVLDFVFHTSGDLLLLL